MDILNDIIALKSVVFLTHNIRFGPPRHLWNLRCLRNAKGLMKKKDEKARCEHYFLSRNLFRDSQILPPGHIISSIPYSEPGCVHGGGGISLPAIHMIVPFQKQRVGLSTEAL
jgi:hypothetical protein